MLSRYTLMKTSLVLDEGGDNQPYGDSLSIDFSTIDYTEPPFKYNPTEQFLYKPYSVTMAFYGADTSGLAAYDDIVLNINNIPHISLVDPILNPEIIDIPALSDMSTFIENNSNG